MSICHRRYLDATELQIVVAALEIETELDLVGQKADRRQVPCVAPAHLVVYAGKTQIGAQVRLCFAIAAEKDQIVVPGQGDKIARRMLLQIRRGTAQSP